MYTEVYVDVLFMINFSMDAVALFLTARLCSMKLNLFRICFAASLGALYSVLVLLFELAAPFEMLIFLCVSVIMVSIALVPVGMRETAKASFVLFISSALLGGIMSALYSVMTDVFKSVPAIDGGSYLTPFRLIILAVVSLCASMILTSLHGTGKLPEFGEAEIVIWKMKRIVRGAFDSGNLLTDPLSGKAVIVLKPDCLRGILSNGFIESAMSGNSDVSRCLNERERSRFRLIPAKGIVGSTYLYGIVPDEVVVTYTYKGKTKRCERDAVIALMHGNDDDLDCIIPSSII